MSKTASAREDPRPAPSSPISAASTFSLRFTSVTTPVMSRLTKELAALEKDPPPGTTVWPADDANVTRLAAVLAGPQDTPYDDGSFTLRIRVPDRYPFEPPDIVFETPVYHPNVDNQGRICLDLLKMPPKGSWKPSLNLSTLLTSIRLLLAEPNIDDPLAADVAAEYRENRPLFLRKAREFTQRHACHGFQTAGAGNGGSSSVYNAEQSPMETNGIFSSSTGLRGETNVSGSTIAADRRTNSASLATKTPQKRKINLSLKSCKKTKSEE